MYQDQLDPFDTGRPFCSEPTSDAPDDYEYDNGFHHAVIRFLSAIGTILIALIIGAALTMFMGCATRTVTVIETRTDTLRITQRERDSIFVDRYLRDSISQTQRGDTIILDRWHTQTRTEYRDRWLHDSIYVAKHDSVPVPYPVEKKVEKPLSWWQNLRIWIGNIILIAAGAWLVAWIGKKCIKNSVTRFI